jgi:hypothetical protein
MSLSVWLEVAFWGVLLIVEDALIVAALVG